MGDELPSLEGRTFRDVTEVPAGDVSGLTTFNYHEVDGVIWADYAGGVVVRGYLVGTRAGDTLDFRYAHLARTGDTASGHCSTIVELLDDGRLRLNEKWEWESQPGAGVSVVEEVRV